MSKKLVNKIYRKLVESQNDENRDKTLEQHFGKKLLVALIRDAENLKQVLSKIAQATDKSEAEKKALALRLSQIYSFSIAYFKELMLHDIERDQALRNSRLIKLNNIIGPLLIFLIVLSSIFSVPQITTILVLKILGTALFSALTVRAAIQFTLAFLTLCRSSCDEFISIKNALFGVTMPDCLAKPELLSWKSEDLHAQSEQTVTYAELKQARAQLKQLHVATSAATPSTLASTDEAKTRLLDAANDTQPAKMLFFKANGGIRKIRGEKLCFGTQQQYQQQKLLFKANKLIRDTKTDHTEELQGLAQQYVAVRS